MSERDDQRLARRVGCEDPEALPAPGQATPPHIRRVDPCEIPPATPAEVFVVPAARPPPVITTPYRVPTLDVGNQPQTQTCADKEDAGPVGDSVTVPADTLLETVTLLDIPNLTDAQGRFIAGLADDVLRSLLTADVVTVARICKLNTSQAAFVVGAIATAQAAANGRAIDLAQLSLICVWLNEAQTANCPDGAIATGSPSPAVPPPVNTVTIAAGLFSSSTSQDNANSQALAAGQQQLNCIWHNAAVTRTCQDNGFTEAVPVDQAPLSPKVSRRVGVVTIAAGVLASTDGQIDADSRAQQLADSQLVCFYLNAEVTRDCVSIGKQGTAVVGPGVDAPGNPVTIPAYTITSQLSTPDATAEAVVLAVSLLSCFWLNAEVKVSCPEQTINPGLPGEVVVQPSDKSLVKDVVIAAGTVRSDISQEDADTQAVEIATEQLDCLYCNKEVKPVCTQPPGSLDITTGVPANTYCSNDAAASQAIAEQIGSIPDRALTDGTICTYGNIEITVTCDTKLGNGANNAVAPGARKTATVAANAVLVTPQDVPEGYEGSPIDYANSVAKTQALTLLDCFFWNDAVTKTCADLGLLNVYIKSTASVTVPAGTFTSYTSKAEAQALADTQALSGLNCYYANPKSTYLCDNGANNGSYNPAYTTTGGVRIYGTGSMQEIGAFKVDRRPVAPGSRGSTTWPVELAEALFTSVVSQAEVDAMALAYASGILNCFFTSQLIFVFCGALAGAVMRPTSGNLGAPGAALVYGDGNLAGTGVVARATGSSQNPVTVAAGTFSSPDSTGAANAQALLVGVSQLDCFVESTVQTVMCGMGLAIDGLILGNFHPSAIYTSTAAPGTVISYVSQADADNRAMAVAQGGLLCVYTNGGTKGGTCPPAQPIQVSDGKLPKNSVTSFLSQADAQDTAQQLTDALTSCMSPDQVGGGAAAGNDGAQTNCDGQCFGFYS